MEKLLTNRQGTLLIICAAIATKIQRLPSIIAHDIGRDGWFAGLMLFLIDALFIFIVTLIMDNLNGRTIYEIIQDVFGKIGVKFFCLIFIIFFFMKSVITFKGTHEFFATTLFDMLSWQVFSILLLILLFAMVINGLRVIGRSAELYIYLILFGFISAVALGAYATDFSKILPFLDVNISQMFGSISNYTLHFGDYLIVIFLVGNIKNISKKTKWIYAGANLAVGLIAAFAYIVFYGIYDNVAEYQYHALADITQFSLIGLGLGRLDWFLILFVLIATFISTGLFLWIVVYSIQTLFNVKKMGYIITIVLIGLYIVELYIFNNTESIYLFLKNGFRYFTVFVELVIPIVLILSFIIIRKRNNRRIGT